MNKNKILIVNGSYYGAAVEGLGELCYESQDFLEHPEDYILILFTGGEDVSPALYDDISPKGYCHTSPARDSREKTIFDCALKHGIKMTGICRGSQFINVMSGGRMLHHINGHGLGGEHTMSNHKNDEIIEVTSTHHQMSVPGPDGLLVAWSTAKRSDVYIGREDKEEAYDGPEVESLLYPSTKCFGVQYHPEYMYTDSPGYKWYWQAVKDFLELSMEDFIATYTDSKDDALSLEASA